MPKSTLKAWDVFDEHFDVGDTIAIGLHFERPVRDEDVELIEELRLALNEIPGTKQVYDVSLVAKEIESVPLTTLIDPANRKRYSLYDGALWD